MIGDNLKALIDSIKAKLSGFLSSAKAEMLDIWNHIKGPLVLAAIAALIFKFRDIWLGILINSAQRVEKTSKTQDAKLENQEDALKQQSDALVQQSLDEPKKETAVAEDWYEKKD